MILTYDLPSGRLLVTDIDTRYQTIGQRLLERLAAPASALASGSSMTVDLGWFTVKLRADKDMVVAEEPDYVNKATVFRPSLTLTSRICFRQQQLIELLETNLQPVGATQYVHVSNQAMDAVSVVGYRGEEQGGPLTAWEIVSTIDTLDSASFGYYTVRELAAHRPAWLVGLSLPEKWSFRYVGNTLIDCVSPKGETHFTNLPIDL